MKTLSQTAQNDVVKCENLLRKRLQKYGYRLSRGTTAMPGQRKNLRPDQVRKGYRVSDLTSGQIVFGKYHEATLQQVEKLWLEEYTRRCIEKREARRRERLAQLASARRSSRNIFDDAL